MTPRLTDWPGWMLVKLVSRSTTVVMLEPVWQKDDDSLEITVPFWFLITEQAGKLCV
jgi:hypothetical protein